VIADWESLETRLRLPGLARRSAARLARSAEPEAAARRAHDILLAAHARGPGALASAWEIHGDSMLRILCVLCGAAPFFAPILERHPDWLLRLAASDLRRARSGDQMRAALDRVFDGSAPDDPATALRRFKYFELARITVRELDGYLVPEREERIILGELSDLAGAILGRAIEVARARAGAGVWTDERGNAIRPGFCVLALGKLGGEELNYSSDVDLIYVYQATAGPLTGGPRDESPAEYMTRIATEFGRIVTPVTAEGFLYRIDLDLRPEGAQGALVISSEALAEYYDTRAATWERTAFMKARPVAGDLDLGWRVVRWAAPMLFRRSMDFASVAAIRDLKEGVEKEKGRRGDSFNVKIGSGGIRDIECVAQAMQLVHGGRIPQVRGRSTPEALESLRDAGVLKAPAARDLLDAYLFLRRVENRIQMVAERQVHDLPADDRERRRLARSLDFAGDDPWRAFEMRLGEHRARVRKAFEELLPDAPGERVRDLFHRFAGDGRRSLLTAHLLEQLADRFGLAIAKSADPQRAINNLRRFVEGLGDRSFYYELLLDRPELVERLANLFAASEYLSGILAVHPRLIEPIFEDPETLLLDRAGLEASLRDIRSQLEGDGRTAPELDLEALRLFHERETVNVGLLDLAGRVSLHAVSSALTDIAEIALEQALALAVREMGARAEPAAADLLIIGMGGSARVSSPTEAIWM